jgi:protein-disulfide isomerase
MDDRIAKFFIPTLVVLLVVMAFGMGLLYQKVDNLEKGKVAGAAVGAGTPGSNAPTAVQPPTDTATPKPADPNKLKEAAASGFAQGSKNAPVTFIEFADYQCPFCERFYTDVTKNLIKDYVSTGKVRFVYHDFAFLDQSSQDGSKESHWAAEAARCANDQGKYWEFHDYLFEHQKGENQGGFSKDNLKKFAVDLGLNPTQFNTCLDSGKYTKAVQDDTTLGQDLGVNGTPMSFINGTPLNGALPYATVKQTIDPLLK